MCVPLSLAGRQAPQEKGAGFISMGHGKRRGGALGSYQILFATGPAFRLGTSKPCSIPRLGTTNRAESKRRFPRSGCPCIQPTRAHPVRHSPRHRRHHRPCPPAPTPGVRPSRQPAKAKLNPHRPVAVNREKRSVHIPYLGALKPPTAALAAARDNPVRHHVISMGGWGGGRTPTG